MINSIPVLGWACSLIVSISLAVPFWFIWIIQGFGRFYFPFLPAQFQAIPFWDCVGLFIVCGILKFALLPKVSNHQECEVEK